MIHDFALNFQFSIYNFQVAFSLNTPLFALRPLTGRASFPAFLGEMALMLWFVIMGVNVRKWEEREQALAGGDNYLDVLRINEPRSGDRG